MIMWSSFRLTGEWTGESSTCADASPLLHGSLLLGLTLQYRQSHMHLSHEGSKPLVACAAWEQRMVFTFLCGCKKKKKKKSQEELFVTWRSDRTLTFGVHRGSLHTFARTLSVAASALHRECQVSVTGTVEAPSAGAGYHRALCQRRSGSPRTLQRQPLRMDTGRLPAGLSFWGPELPLSLIHI